MGKFGGNNVWWKWMDEGFGKKVRWMNRLANRLLIIVTTNLDGFSLANYWWFAKFTKHFRYTVFSWHPRKLTEQLQCLKMIKNQIWSNQLHVIELQCCWLMQSYVIERVLIQTVTMCRFHWININHYIMMYHWLFHHKYSYQWRSEGRLVTSTTVVFIYLTQDKESIVSIIHAC